MTSVDMLLAPAEVKITSAETQLTFGEAQMTSFDVLLASATRGEASESILLRSLQENQIPPFESDP